MSYFERVVEIRTKAQRSTGNLYDTYFTRRISPWITAAMVPLGFTPNGVSWANLLVGASSCLLIALGSVWQTLVGVLLIHVYAVLDSVDGELARLMNRCSMVGVFLETWSAYLMINGFMVAIAAHLTRFGNGTWPLILAVGVAAFGRSASPAIRRAVIERRASAPVWRAASEARVSLVESQSSARIPRFVVDSLLYHTNVWIVLSTALALQLLVFPSERSLLPSLFALYSFGAIAKEVGVIVLATRTPHIERELERISTER